MSVASRSLIFTLLVATLLVACGKDSVPDLSAEEIIADSAARMADLRGFEFLIERSGDPVFLDPDQTVAFRRAEGQFQFPDRVSASVRLILPGLVTEMSIIGVGGRQWETNLLTGEWQDTDPAYSFDPSKLFQAENGLPAVLANDLHDIRLIGLQELPEVPGLQLFAIEASVQGQRISTMSFGMIGAEDLLVSLWVEPDSYDLHRVIIFDPGGDEASEGSTWQIDFWNFDASFIIQAPSTSQLHGQNNSP